MVPVSKRGNQNQEALVPSQGSFVPKLHLRCEGEGKPMTFPVTAGQRHETTQFEPLM